MLLAPPLRGSHLPHSSRVTQTLQLQTPPAVAPATAVLEPPSWPAVARRGRGLPIQLLLRLGAGSTKSGAIHGVQATAAVGRQTLNWTMTRRAAKTGLAHCADILNAELATPAARPLAHNLSDRYGQVLSPCPWKPIRSRCVCLDVDIALPLSTTSAECQARSPTSVYMVPSEMPLASQGVSHQRCFA